MGMTWPRPHSGVTWLLSAPTFHHPQSWASGLHPGLHTCTASYVAFPFLLFIPSLFSKKKVIFLNPSILYPS